MSGYLGVIARRRLSLETPVGTEVRQKPGPLQLIFELPPDEVNLGYVFHLSKKKLLVTMFGLAESGNKSSFH